MFISSILIRILNKLNLLEYFNFNASNKINNRDYIIPIVGKIGLPNLFTWEPWMIDLLRIVVQIGGNKFIDVGANVGQTLLNIKSVAPDIEYIGFEPNPTCVFYLNKLIAKNSFSYTTIIPVGISTINDLVQFNFYSKNEADGSASMIHAFREVSKVTRTSYFPVFAVSSLKNHLYLEDVSILKIDVEGAEMEVIISFYDEILRSNPIIIIEILPVYDQSRSLRLDRQLAIEKYMRELNYVKYSIKKNDERLIRIQFIEEIGIHSDLNNCEYVFVPIAKQILFEELAKNFITEAEK